MVRYDYIYHKVLMLYDQMPFIRFPIEPCDMIAALANCKQLTYQKFAEINGCTIQDVIALCQSKSGCTHYDVAEDRYLILWNADGAENNVEGRRRWTKAHELGHVVLEHLPPLAVPKLAENSFQRLTAPELEFEADRFAATLLAPAPLYADLHILSPQDIRRRFGLSAEAASNRWTDYQRWIHCHRKTAWENDIRQIYQWKKG